MKNWVRSIINSAGFNIIRVPRGKSIWSYNFDYPIDPVSRWGFGRASHPQLKTILEANLNDYVELLRLFQTFRSDFIDIPLEPPNQSMPAWNNGWFTGLDAAALMSFIRLRTPNQYLEIGSGNSTKFARHTITSKGLKTRLTSIDPNPRTEIDLLCDDTIRQPLETVNPQIFERLSDNDILFFDGSHRTFTNSDVTAFFFDILPRIKPGVLIHIHDIFWPDDYPPEWKWRLYSEQYLLGALLLSGNGTLRVRLPNYFVYHHPLTAPLVAALGFPNDYPASSMSPVSFWCEVL